MKNSRSFEFIPQSTADDHTRLGEGRGGGGGATPPVQLGSKAYYLKPSLYTTFLVSSNLIISKGPSINDVSSIFRFYEGVPTPVCSRLLWLNDPLEETSFLGPTAPLPLRPPIYTMAGAHLACILIEMNLRMIYVIMKLIWTRIKCNY